MGQIYGIWKGEKYLVHDGENALMFRFSSLRDIGPPDADQFVINSKCIQETTSLSPPVSELLRLQGSKFVVITLWKTIHSGLPTNSTWHNSNWARQESHSGSSGRDSAQLFFHLYCPASRSSISGPVLTEGPGHGEVHMPLIPILCAIRRHHLLQHFF